MQRNELGLRIDIAKLLFSEIKMPLMSIDFLVIQLTDNILHKKRTYDDVLEKQYHAFCFKIGATAKDMKQTQRKYWLLNDIEIELYEGGVKQVSMNRYERDSKVRRRCIEKYGTTCQVCGVSFKDMYVDIGEGFIHAHHIIPSHIRKNGTKLMRPSNPSLS